MAETIPNDDDQQWVDSLGFDEHDVHDAGRRLAVVWDPWMNDWFTSSSPRNGNSNAEGPWTEWVDLALAILGDPMTEVVRPDAYRQSAAPNWTVDRDRMLTASELRQRFDKSRGES